MGAEKLVFWFEELGKEHNDAVGKKCANLGEMTRMGLPVPPGFALSIGMYESFLRESAVDKKISSYVSGVGNLAGASITRFEEVSQHLRSMIEEATVPKDVEAEIVSHYEQLCDKLGALDVAVSVRSAGTASRPGMFETYLNVKGKGEVLSKVKKVWASAFTPRAIAFRANKGIAIDADKLGVAVVKMVNARSAGIGFTADPVTGDASKVVIEANWGLGEGVVSGEESVDRFVVDKQSLEVLERAVGKKLKQVVNTEEGAEWRDMPPEMQSVPCLTDSEIKGVVELAKHLEEKLGQAQDMEWAIDPDFPDRQNVFLLQTRPEKIFAREPESATDQLADKLVSGFKQIDLSEAKKKIKGIEFRF